MTVFRRRNSHREGSKGLCNKKGILLLSAKIYFKLSAPFL
jgi:hypothetical protein